MGANQLYKMIAAEAFTYAILGCIVGCVLGLPLNKLMFQFLIADKWGIAWQIPVGSLLLIVFLCLASAAVAIDATLAFMLLKMLNTVISAIIMRKP